MAFPDSRSHTCSVPPPPADTARRPSNSCVAPDSEGVSRRASANLGSASGQVAATPPTSRAVKTMAIPTHLILMPYFSFLLGVPGRRHLARSTAPSFGDSPHTGDHFKDRKRTFDHQQIHDSILPTRNNSKRHDRQLRCWEHSCHLSIRGALDTEAGVTRPICTPLLCPVWRLNSAAVAGSAVGHRPQFTGRLNVPHRAKDRVGGALVGCLAPVDALELHVVTARHCEDRRPAVTRLTVIIGEVLTPILLIPNVVHGETSVPYDTRRCASSHANLRHRVIDRRIGILSCDSVLSTRIDRDTRGGLGDRSEIHRDSRFLRHKGRIAPPTCLPCRARPPTSESAWIVTLRADLV